MAKIVGIGHYEAPGTAEMEYSPYIRGGGVFGQDTVPALNKGLQQTLCEKMGGVWNPSTQQCVKPPAPSPETIAAWKQFCESAGLKWDPVTNQCLQSAPPNVITPGALACQAAGGTWNAATNQCMGLPPPPMLQPPPPPQDKKPAFDLRALAVLVGVVVVGAYLYKEYGGKTTKTKYARNVYKPGRHFDYDVYTSKTDRKPTYQVRAIDAKHALQQAKEIATEYTGVRVDTRQWQAVPHWEWNT